MQYAVAVNVRGSADVRGATGGGVTTAGFRVAQPDTISTNITIVMCTRQSRIEMMCVVEPVLVMTALGSKEEEGICRQHHRRSRGLMISILP